MHDKPFALIGVHVGGTDAKQLNDVMTKEQLPWRSFADAGNAGAGPISKQFNFPPTPSFYLIDHAGVIRYKWSGSPGEEVLDSAIEKLILAAEESQNNAPK